MRIPCNLCLRKYILNIWIYNHLYVIFVQFKLTVFIIHFYHLNLYNVWWWNSKSKSLEYAYPSYIWNVFPLPFGHSSHILGSIYNIYSRTLCWKFGYIYVTPAVCQLRFTIPNCPFIIESRKLNSWSFISCSFKKGFKILW